MFLAPALRVKVSVFLELANSVFIGVEISLEEVGERKMLGVPREVFKDKLVPIYGEILELVCAELGPSPVLALAGS